MTKGEEINRTAIAISKCTEENREALAGLSGGAEEKIIWNLSVQIGTITAKSKVWTGVKSPGASGSFSA